MVELTQNDVVVTVDRKACLLHAKSPSTGMASVVALGHIEGIIVSNEFVHIFGASGAQYCFPLGSYDIVIEAWTTYMIDKYMIDDLWEAVPATEAV